MTPSPAPTPADTGPAARRAPWACMPLLLALLLPVPGLAQESAEVLYEQANEAFKAGEYRRALAGFLDAQRAGMTNATLSYNLGSTYYRLGDYEAAEQAFLEAAQDPAITALAYYNLGLVAIKQGRRDLALEWFQQVLDETSDDRLRSLAKRAIKRADGSASAPKAKTPPAPAAVEAEGTWAGFLDTSLGYDDNVTLQDDTQPTISSHREDRFLELFGYGSRPILGTLIEGASLDLSAYLRKHQDISAYDFTSLRAGASLDDRWGAWRVESAAYMDYGLLDNRGFTRTLSLSLDGRRALSRTQQLRLEYELSRIDEVDTRYSYLAGWRHQALIESRWRGRRHRVRASYELEVNDRADRTTPVFTSFSPVRHRLRVQDRYRLSEDYEIAGDLRYRLSRYRDANDLGGGNLVKREDDRYRAILKLTRLLAQGREISAEYQFTDNESNLASEDYRRGEYSISLFVPW